MIQKKKDKPGINRALKCRKCGHKVGYVRLKTRFRVKVWLWIFVLALITQILSEIVGRLVLGD